jgi:DNA uptake protein ComE-like DNA-binding protein
LSPLSPVKANINSASVTELAAIPEMSFDLAQEIISLRQQDGKYRNLVDLASRLNLDSHLTSQLMHYLRF